MHVTSYIKSLHCFIQCNYANILCVTGVSLYTCVQPIQMLLKYYANLIGVNMMPLIIASITHVYASTIMMNWHTVQKWLIYMLVLT